MTPLSLFKLIGGPGSIGFLACGSAIGLGLIRVWPRKQRLGRAWLLLLYSSYIVLGLPLVAQVIAAPFEASGSEHQPAPALFDSLLVFDGDNRIGRVRESHQLWSVVQPSVVVVSGDQWLVDQLLEQGIPRARLVHDDVSGTTREQIQYVRAFAVKHPDATVAIVASRLQMPRIIALAHRAGVRALFFASPVDREPARNGFLFYVPSYAALRVSRDALYERVALAYYRWQGWIDPEPAPAIARTW